MDTIKEMALNPCNILASTIPKHQVFSERKFRVQFCVNLSLDIFLVY
jgi:hypothetical protein